MKLKQAFGQFFYRLVAPYAGAWIETHEVRTDERGHRVAPYAGAWIETRPLLPFRNHRFKSPPTRGRGLKLAEDLTAMLDPIVAPYAGAWIETPYGVQSR